MHRPSKATMRENSSCEPAILKLRVPPLLYAERAAWCPSVPIVPLSVSTRGGGRVAAALNLEKHGERA